ncbi:unnamed protein product [Adineta steineri]|uniref:Uncharacterized protein n=1 Tax=Adineta steineri TaxID=433720 RepID=A0A815T6F0_9BILA|nr:unnamed protein product [Adineta steineri]CAF3686600.1 unnamed protein product [Adineta steineri]
MFSSIFQSSRSIIEITYRSFSSKRIPRRSISSQLLFYKDTTSVFGPQQAIHEKKSSESNRLNLSHVNPKKEAFENDTELLYASTNGLHRVCSVEKGISIRERQKYLRHLFRIPRGQRLSLFPQAYIPNKYLGLRKNRNK